MLKHILLLIYRNFKRFKSSFFINLIGLSTGLGCTLLIFLWVNDELSVDKFYKKDAQLYQVMQNMHRTNGVQTIEATPGPLAKSLDEEMPEVEYSVAVIPTTFNTSKGVISTEDTHIKSTGQYVSKDFFNIFSYKLIYGDKQKVLSEKKGIVISKELALKLFQSVENAVGKTIDWKTQSISGLGFVSGVFESPPSNATTRFDLLLNYEWFEEIHPLTRWGNSSPRTYILLKEGTSPDKFNDKIRNFIKSKDKDSDATLFIQRYSDRYLYSRYENGVPAGGRIEYVKLFSIIAIFTLVIACINFMNLSTAKASRRVKEVGIKKAVGAGRKSLVFQYLGESTVMAFLSLTLAVFFVELLLPRFNQITGKQLALSFDTNLILSVLGITLITGLIAGSYPALYFSRFNPASVLKGKLNTSLGEKWTRKGLVVFQFALSVILIVSVWIVYKQIEFVQSKKLGYNRDHVIYFETEKINNAFISQLENIPGVLYAGGGSIEAGDPIGGTSDIQWEGKNPENNIFFSRLWVGYGLIETLEMEMVAGRAFSEDFGSHDQIIFNEAAIKIMGLKAPIGKIIKIGTEEREVVGVVKDFHFESLYEEVKPVAVLLAPMEYAPKISVKIQVETEARTIGSIQKVYQKHNPGLVFDFKFMDDDYQRLYASEQRVSTLSNYFAGLAILISCLGLFGLAAFTTERRTKEIGIRKVLGATASKIVVLLSKDFAMLVGLSILIAIPVAWYVMSEWLQNFAYRIEITWSIFLLAGLITILIALATVSYQAIKAARLDPVNSLRSE